MTAARYPLEALEVAVAGRHLSLTEIAALFGTTHRTACRWRSSGLSERQADHLAAAQGLPAAFVWGDLWATGTKESAA